VPPKNWSNYNVSKIRNYIEARSGPKGTLKVDGVLVHVGLDPYIAYLEGVVPLDGQRQAVVNEWMKTEILGIFAAGEIRSDSPR
jgi:thioredoxin reductase